MRVSALSLGELARRLRRTGVILQIGPFIVRLESPIPSIVEGIARLYADYPLENKTRFADFHIRLAPPRNLRRWIRPQVLFLFDGHPPFKPLPLDQAFPMLEWGLNWCVHNHLHQALILHAAVVEKGGYAAILPGSPGTGKSTLCAALVNRGWRLLTDELALISPEDGMLTPLPRPISLKNESIDVIRRFAPGVVIGPEASDTNKGTVAHMKVPSQSVARWDERARPAWLIFPRYQANIPTRLEPQSKGRTFMRAAEQSFNYSRLGLTGFRALTKLIDACACFEFTYGDLAEASAHFAALERPRTPSGL